MLARPRPAQPHAKDLHMSAPSQSITPSQAARDFLARRHQLFIGGQWVDPAEPGDIEVFDPATEARIATVARGGPKDIDRAVAAARAAFEGEWSRIGSHQRSRLLFRLADQLEPHLDLAVEL